MSKKKLPWFPCYPEDWLEDTRHMTDTQARVYWDFLCLIYIHDGLVKSTDKWIAHELHIHIHKWRTVRKFLVDDKKLVENPDGSLTNSRAAKVCLERKARSDTLGNLASNRELTRRVTRWESPELPFEINKGRAPLCLVSDHGAAPHSHLHSDQEQESKKEKRRPLPHDIVAALVAMVGQQKADAYMNDYHDIGYAAGATSLRSGFLGYLEKHHGVILGNELKEVRRGARSASTLMADVLAALPKNRDGKPDTSMPDMSKRVVGKRS